MRLQASHGFRRRVPIMKIKPGQAVGVGREDSELAGVEGLDSRLILLGGVSHHIPQEALPAAPGGVTAPHSGFPKTLCGRRQARWEPTNPDLTCLWVPSLIQGQEKGPSRWSGLPAGGGSEGTTDGLYPSKGCQEPLGWNSGSSVC